MADTFTWQPNWADAPKGSATDAEGLAATGGLYDDLAGYTIITVGALI